VAWARTFLIVVVGWVFFRANGLDQAVAMLKVMAGLSSPTVVFYDLQAFAVPHNVFFALCGLAFALLPFEGFSMRLDGTKRVAALKAAGGIVLFGYSMALLSVNSFNPFIYFRF
jgi:alginate O-acetyltransferase complex protein AlgI